MRSLNQQFQKTPIIPRISITDSEGTTVTFGGEDSEYGRVFEVSIQADIDSGYTADMSFRNHPDIGPSLDPLDSSSPFNDGTISTNLMSEYNDVKIEISKDGGSNWYLVFSGFVGDVTARKQVSKDDIIDFSPYGKSKALKDVPILEDAPNQPYEYTDAYAVDIVDQILEDNGFNLSVNRSASDLPDKYIDRVYPVKNTTVWKAMEEAISDTGYELMFMPVDNSFDLVIVDPLRGEDQDIDHTFAGDFSQRRLEHSDKDVRTEVVVFYNDRDTGARERVTVSDDEAKQKYGADDFAGGKKHRTQVLKELDDTSLIDTEVEAERYANATLNDLKAPAPDLSFEFEYGVPGIQLYDVVEAGGTSDYTVWMGVTSISYSFSVDRQIGTTTINGSANRVIGRHDYWLNQGQLPDDIDSDKGDRSAPPKPDNPPRLEKTTYVDGSGTTRAKVVCYGEHSPAWDVESYQFRYRVKNVETGNKDEWKYPDQVKNPQKTITGLEVGNDLELQVEYSAIDWENTEWSGLPGDSPYSDTGTVSLYVDITPPNAPSALTAEAGPNRISLDWDIPQKNQDGTDCTDLSHYNVYRTTSSGTSTDSSELSSNASSGSYEVEVKDVSQFSDGQGVKLIEESGDEVSEINRIDYISGDVLNMDRALDNTYETGDGARVETIKVVREVDADTWRYETNDTSTEYYFAVTAVDSSYNESQLSNQVGPISASETPTGDGYAPTVPSGLSLNDRITLQDDGSAVGKIIVNWNDVTTNTEGEETDDVLGYEVAICDNDNNTCSIDSEGNLTDSWEIEGSTESPEDLIAGLDVGVEYAVTVRAYDYEDKYSDWHGTDDETSIKTQTISSDDTFPNSPTLNKVKGHPESIYVKWTKPDNNTDGSAINDFSHCLVYESESSGIDINDELSYEDTHKIDGEHWIHEDLDTENTRYYVITAVDQTGNESTASSEKSASPNITVGDQTPPAVPTGLEVVSNTIDYQEDGTVYSIIKLSWDKNTEEDLKGYEVASSSDGSNWSIHNITESSEYTLKPLKPNTEYHFRINAVDTEQNKSDWTSPIGPIETARDTTPPENPTGLSASNKIGSIEFSWNQVTENDDDEGSPCRDLDYYKIDVTGGNTYTTKSTSYTLYGSSTSTIEVTVSTVDTSGNESTGNPSTSGSPELVQAGDSVLDLGQWNFTGEFYSNDYHSVGWQDSGGSGTSQLKSAGKSFDINDGSVSSISQLTYIYYDASNSTSNFETSTNIDAALGNEKILVAAADSTEVGNEATFQVYQGSDSLGFQPYVVSEYIETDAITAEEADLQKIFSSAITVNSGGYIKSEFYDGTSKGFRINANGTAEFYEVTVEGSITITSGSGVGNLSDSGLLAEYDPDDINHTGSTAPDNPDQGWLWRDTSTDPRKLKRYDGGNWETVSTVDASWSGVVNDDGNKPEDGATKGADWESTLANIPDQVRTDLTEGLNITSNYLGFTIDGSVSGLTAFINGSDGSGQLAGGDISWDQDGNAKFTGEVRVGSSAGGWNIDSNSITAVGDQAYISAGGGSNSVGITGYSSGSGGADSIAFWAGGTHSDLQSTDGGSASVWIKRGGDFKFGDYSGGQGIKWENGTLNVEGSLTVDYAEIGGTKPPSDADNTEENETFSEADAGDLAVQDTVYASNISVSDLAEIENKLTVSSSVTIGESVLSNGLDGIRIDGGGLEISDATGRKIFGSSGNFLSLPTAGQLNSATDSGRMDGHSWETMLTIADSDVILGGMVSKEEGDPEDMKDFQVRVNDDSGSATISHPISLNDSNYSGYGSTWKTGDWALQANKLPLPILQVQGSATLEVYNSAADRRNWQIKIWYY